MIFHERFFSCYILLTVQFLFSDCLYFLRCRTIYVLQFLFPRLWRHRFWNLLYLSNEAGFSTWLKSQDKTLNILRTKRILRWNKKDFWSFLKGFQLPEIASDLRVHLHNFTENGVGCGCFSRNFWHLPNTTLHLYWQCSEQVLLKVVDLRR